MLLGINVLYNIAIPIGFRRVINLVYCFLAARVAIKFFKVLKFLEQERIRLSVIKKYI